MLRIFWQRDRTNTNICVEHLTFPNRKHKRFIMQLMLVMALYSICWMVQKTLLLQLVFQRTFLGTLLRLFSFSKYIKCGNRFNRKFLLLKWIKLFVQNELFKLLHLQRQNQAAVEYSDQVENQVLEYENPWNHSEFSERNSYAAIQSKWYCVRTMLP